MTEKFWGTGRGEDYMDSCLGGRVRGHLLNTYLDEHHSCSVDKEPILKGDNSIFMVQTRKQNDLADLGSDPCLT